MLELLGGPLGPLLIFMLRVVDVSLGTIRLLLVTRGRRLPASLLGFIEILIWITAAGTAIRNLSSVPHILGYAGGFGAGTWVGMWLEEKLALGTATVQAFCRERHSGVAEMIRAMGMGATEVVGEGMHGPVDVVSTVVERQLVPRVLEAIEAKDPDAFITVYDARIRRGWLPKVPQR